MYKKDPDSAYQKLLQHGVGVLTKDVSKTEMKADNTPMDFVYIAKRIPHVVKELHGAHFVQPAQNGGLLPPLAPLPTPIPDNSPVMSKTDKDNQQANRFYDELKKSVKECDQVHHENELPDDSIVNLGKCLKVLHLELDVSGSAKIKHYFLIGKVLLAMKNKEKEFMEHVKDQVQYSSQHVYFLIDFYKQCVKYPRLKMTSLPIRKVKRWFCFTKAKLNEDAMFWLQQNA